MIASVFGASAGELPERRLQRGRQRHLVEGVFGHRRRPENVVARDRFGIADMGEQVAAQQCLRLFLEHQPGIPAMGHMRGVEIADLAPAQIDGLAIGQRARRPVGHVVERHHGADGAMGDFGLGGGGQPQIHGAGLVGFQMAEADPAQALDRHDLGHGLGDQRKHRARPAMEEQRHLGIDQELVEGEAGGRRHLRQPGSRAGRRAGRFRRCGFPWFGYPFA